MCALLACAEDVPITTEAERVQREVSERTELGRPLALDLVLMLARGERQAAMASVHRQLRELISGDADADGTADHGSATTLRVAVLSEAELSAISTAHPEYPGWWNACTDPNCVPTERVAQYRWEPYGFAPSFDAFLADVDCLLSSGDATTCAIDTANNFSFLGGGAFALTSDDLAQPSVPPDIFGPCFGDSVPWGLTPYHQLDAALFDADGRAQCQVLETLPSDGAITRCAQLDDFGRSFHHIDDDGRQVCAIDQLLTDDDGVPEDGYGFYYYVYDARGAQGERGQPTTLNFFPLPTPTPDFPPTCGVPTESGPYLLMSENTPFITSSIIESHCALATD